MGSSSIPDGYEQVLDAVSPIPFDLFVSKKQKKGFGSGSCIRFTNSCGNLVFKVERPPNNNKNESTTASHGNPSIKLLLDASGSTLFSIHKLNWERTIGELYFVDGHVKTGSWQGFRVNDSTEELIFRVEKTLNKLTRTEFEIFLLAEKSDDSKPDFMMRGSPFKRSCTIYKGDSIVAETSLMYKLGIKNAFVPRSRFRVTIFPGYSDPSLVVALIVIFFGGRKLWI